MICINLTRPGGWKSFNFPDGQPHITLSVPMDDEVMIETRIASSDDLMRLLLTNDAIQRVRPRPVHVMITYLMGARMDRAIPPSGGWMTAGFATVVDGAAPLTLQVIADVLATAKFASIAVLDPHSDVTLALLRAQPVAPTAQVRLAVSTLPKDTLLVAPDAGAIKRVESLAKAVGRSGFIAYAIKRRDVQTGRLSGFQVLNPDVVNGRPCLIVDDLIDGGGTFTGLAEKLRAAGATEVYLYATHGIFSKGYDIAGIDRIFTTDSYRDLSDAPSHVTVMSWDL